MSQWGSNLSYVPPPPVNPSNYEPVPPLQPHLTGLTEFEGDRTFGPQDNTPMGPGPNISDDPTILVQTLLSEFRVFQHNVETRLHNLEQNIQGSLFTNDHFNQLRTDLQMLLTQTQLVRQPTGTQRPAPRPPIPQPPAPPVQTSTQRIKLAKPEKFDGKKEKSTAFKVSLMQYLRTTYPGTSEEDQIAFILSYLDGKAAEWIEPHVEFDMLHRPVAWLHNVNLFWAEFEKRFGEIDRSTKALKKLKTLRQKQSVQDYVTEFQTLATHVNYDDLALRDMFYEGLKDEIKMAMLSQMFNVKDDATSGQMVVDRALLIDQHLEQFAGRTIFENKNTSSSNKPATSTNTGREKLSAGDAVYMIGTDGRAVKGKIESVGRNIRGQAVPNVKWAGKSSTVQVPFPALKKDDRPNQGTSRAPPPPPALAKARGPGPMDLDGEKRSGGIVCLRCQGKGHMARDCPSKPISGYEAKIEEVKEPDSDDESVKDNA
ncbi:Retrotransposon gag protein [Ceratobasidium sp. AG-Ba]|nr:Retrotransposon gag protein [Ceratobasidium sp. AG-Ba]QRW01153.1 Retrotransposon gag protein [Ceratobasidium sp. AG-Ba]